MGAAEVGVDGDVHLYDFDLFVKVVIVGVDGGDFFVEHEMCGSKFIVNIFVADF